MRTVELKQIGYRVKGEVELNLWGDGTGIIPMEPTDIEELTTENVIRSINDNGFGCESYAGAEVDIYVLYERGVVEYLTSASFTQEDLVGCTRANTDFKKLAEDYEKNSHVIADNEVIADKEVKYLVDIYNDGSDTEAMTREQLINFAEEQVQEWYNEISLRVTDEHGNVVNKEYAEGYRIADKVVNENYKIQGIAEVKELFKLPAITIPFREGDKA